MMLEVEDRFPVKLQLIESGLRRSPIEEIEAVRGQDVRHGEVQDVGAKVSTGTSTMRCSCLYVIWDHVSS